MGRNRELCPNTTDLIRASDPDADIRVSFEDLEFTSSRFDLAHVFDDTLLALVQLMRFDGMHAKVEQRDETL